MADYTKKLRDDIALLKEQKNLLEASAEHTKRYGYEVTKGKTRLEEFNAIMDKLEPSHSSSDNSRDCDWDACYSDDCCYYTAYNLYYFGSKSEFHYQKI